MESCTIQLLQAQQSASPVRSCSASNEIPTQETWTQSCDVLKKPQGHKTINNMNESLFLTVYQELHESGMGDKIIVNT